MIVSVPFPCFTEIVHFGTERTANQKKHC